MFLLGGATTNEGDRNNLFTVYFRAMQQNSHSFSPTEGYTNDVKNAIMGPSYRDAVDVKVVEHVKKEMFSDNGVSTNFQRPIFCLIATAFLRLILA